MTTKCSAAFEQLDRVAAKIDDGGWMAGTPSMSQADVTTAVCWTFAKLARPDLELAERFPQLSRFAERCEALPAFLQAPVPAGAELGSFAVSAVRQLRGRRESIKSRSSW